MSKINEQLEQDLRAAYGIDDEDEELWAFCNRCATMRQYRIVVMLGQIKEVCGTCLDIGKVEETKPVFKLQKRPRC